MKAIVSLMLLLSALFCSALMVSACDLEKDHSLCAQIGACSKDEDGEDGDEDNEKDEKEKEEGATDKAPAEEKAQ